MLMCSSSRATGQCHGFSKESRLQSFPVRAFPSQRSTVPHGSGESEYLISRMPATECGNLQNTQVQREVWPYRRASARLNSHAG